MANEIEDEGIIRRYLLGQLAEDELQQLEERIMTDNELYNRVLLAEDEMVEEYVQGELSESERQGFESSFLSTAEGRKQVDFEKALSEYVSAASASEEQTAKRSAGEKGAGIKEARARASKVIRAIGWSRPTAAPYFRLAAAAVIVAGLGIGFWRVFFHQSDVTTGTAALVQAYREERPLEARISGFNYARVAETRGGQEKVDTVSLDLAANILLNAVAKHPSPAGHHALGKFYLANRDFDKAIAQFDEGLKTDPNNAQLHSDYGAALLEKGRTVRANNDESGLNVEVLARGLEHLNRALALDPKLNEALFDRALLREQMMLMDLAAEDWRAYLERDPNSPWADEARQHLDRLKTTQRVGETQQNVVEEFLTAYRAGDAEHAWELFSPNREKLTTEILAIELDPVDKSTKNGGREALEALVYAGALETDRTGDCYTADLARYYQSISRRQLSAAHKAVQLMLRAREAYGRARVEDAATLRMRARTIFLRIGDKCNARLATYWLALHDWELGKTQQSQALLDPLLASCESDRHLWLRARSLHQRAGVASKLSEYSDAIAREEEARQMAEDLDDPSLVSSARSALIEFYRLLGNQDACFRQIAEANHLLGDPALGPLALWRQYEIQATAFDTFGFPDLAIDYEREALRFAVLAGDFVTTSSCQIHLSAMYSKAQRFDEAFRVAQQAYDEGEANANQSLGQLVMAYATVHIGHLYRRQSDFATARERYDDAIERHKRYGLDFPSHLYQAFKGRLACDIALHDTGAAKQQFATLLELMNEHRAKILEAENRDSFFDVEQSVYDMGIDLAFSQLQKPQEAFQYAEESRGRSLLDSMTAGAQVVHNEGKLDLRLRAGAQSYSLAQIEAYIPDNSRLLQYAVLEEKLLIFIVSRGGLQSAVREVPQATLDDRVSNYLAALKGSSAADIANASRLARELYDDLIAPAVPLLGGSRTLFIVPDKALNHLPWDALISPNHRYVVEDYLLILTPSATLFAICTDMANQKALDRVERALIVGNPTFDRNAFPKLESLLGAEREAETISDFYPSRAALLVGRDAREGTVREGLAGADMAHLSLHCVTNERSAIHSSLLLTKEPRGGGQSAMDGRLQAYEIYELKLPRLRLAVLSACQTGVERYYRGEGMIGMARAFLVARVPLVVASLWPVDSDATAKLMIQFHRYRTQDHKPTAEALRWAKHDLLKGDFARYRQPLYWAAFQVIGGQASF